MQETRGVASAVELEVPPTAPIRSSRKITAALIGIGIASTAALGLLHDAESDRTVAPNRLTQSPAPLSPDAKGTSIVPFPDTSPTIDSVSSIDG